MKRNLKHTRSKARRISVKTLIVLLVFAFASLAAALGGALNGIDRTEGPAAYAVDAQNKTDLGKGGLAVGANAVRASTADFFYTGGVSNRSDYRTKGNTQNGVISLTSGSTSMGFFDPGKQTSSIAFITRIRPSETLKRYISDPALKVTARAYVDIYTQDYVSHDADLSDFCNISLIWYPNNSSSTTSSALAMVGAPSGINRDVTLGSLDTFELISNGMNNDAFLELKFYSFGANTTVTHKEGGVWGIGETTVYDSGVGLKLTNIRIQVEVKLVTPATMAPLSNYQLIGDPLRMPDCEYVKAGDQIIVNSNLRTSGSTASDSSLANIMEVYDVPSSSGIIAWKEGAPSGASSSPDVHGYFAPGISYLIREAMPGTPGNPLDYNLGKTAKFTVRQGAATGQEALIMSYLPIQSYSSVYSQQLKLKIDNALPNAPELNPSSSFMQTVNNNKYFNDRLVFPTNAAFFLPSALEQQGGAKEYIYYTTNGQDPLPGTEYTFPLKGYDANGQVVYYPLDFSHLTTMPQDNVPLKLRTFDGTGNRSSVVLYTVRFDTNDYLISTMFGLGDYIAYSSASNVQAFAKLQFSQAYNLDGTPIFAPSGSTNPDNYIYKRDDKVTIRIEQNSLQYQNYKLNYILGGDWQAANYNVTMTQSGTVYRYDLEFYISHATRTDVRFYFKKKANITVRTISREYTGNLLLPSGVVIDARNQNNVVDPNVNYTVKVKQLSEPAGAYSEEGFVNAGTYNFICVIDSNKYFGSLEGTYTINRIMPDVRDIRISNLIYGAGMDQAIITSLTESSQYSQEISFGGVRGTFTIESPSPFEQLYQLPPAGTHKVIVKFTPEPGPDFDGGMPYNPRVNYGKCILNYKEHIEHNVSIVVLHQGVSVILDTSTFSKVYNGQAQGIVAYSETPEPQPLAIEYKPVGQSDSFYTVQEPIVAGIYEVRATIVEHLSNYRGTVTTEGTELKLVIDKRDIDLVISRDGQQISGLEFYYGHFVKPSQASGLKAGLYLDELDIFDQGEQMLVPVQYFYEISPAGENNFAPLPTEYQLLPAGSYDLKIIVDSTNNRGSVTYPLVIRKGTESYGYPGSNFTVNFPGIELDMLAGGNIVYGQRLSEARLTKGEAYRATYRLYDRSVMVPGRFEVYEDLSEDILVAGTYPDRQLQFIPDDTVNFGIISITVQIIVGKATPDFSQITMTPITYGDKVSDSTHSGAPIYLEEGVEKTVAGTLSVVGGDVVPNAGTMNVLHTFEPADRDNFKSVNNVLIPLVINKKQADITFTLPAGKDGEGNILPEQITDIRRYAANFFSPQITTNPAGLNVAFTYVYQGQNVNITAQSPVGVYYIYAQIVDNNYQGTATNALEIIPADVTVATIPVSSLLRYRMSLAEVTLAGGSCTDGVRTVAGSFSFKYPDTIADSIGENSFTVVFTPDFAQYGNNYNPKEFELVINVQKALVPVSINPASLSVVYNEALQAPTATAQDANGEALDVVFSFVKNGQIYTDSVSEAGSYALTATVNDAYYTGSATATFIIEKAEATIIVAEADRAVNYTGSALSVNATTNKDKPDAPLSIRQSFRNFRNVTLSNAIEVGLYTVTLTIEDNNYRGQLQIQFIVKEESFEFAGLVQVYGSVEPATFSAQPAELTYSLFYKPAGASDTAFSSVLPLIAGAYKVRAVFNQEGYTGYYDRDFIIEKAEGQIICDEEISREYVDGVRTMPASTSPSNLGLRYEYALTENGEVSGEYSSTQPLQVGVYSMRIIIDDANYQGTKVVTYTITPADMDIIAAPFVNTIAYKQGNDAITFTGGTIVFLPNIDNPVSRIIHGGSGGINGGSYSIIADVSTLPAGAHSLQYVFTPESPNFNPVYGFVNLVIQKKDISNLIAFVADDLRQSYNSSNLSVRAYITDEEIAQEVDGIDVLYNGIKLSPTNVGEYVLTANIVDANYRGTITTSGEGNFKILKGVPSIVNPNLSAINVGQKLSDSVISLGYAYITGTESRINGTFSFNEPNLVMDKANMRNVTLLFTPNETHNFQFVTFTMQIMVNGEKPVLVSKQASAITYGAPLSQSSLNVSYNVPGTALWVNPDYVPKVGDVVQYRFIPADYDHYNVVVETINITVQKANMLASNATGIAFVGNTFNSVDIKGDFVNALYPSAKVEGVFQLISVEGYNVTDTVTANLQNVTGTVRFTSPNYNTCEFEISISTYYLINNNIQVRKTIKTYNGAPLNVSDFDILITGTNHSIYPEQFSFTFMKNGVAIDRAETAGVGTYTVELKINDPVYYGVKQFIFVVSKINLTDSIAMQGLTTVFGNITAPTASFGGYTLAPSEYQITYRLPDSVQFDPTLPLAAGSYIARVAINSPIYEGVKTFLFVVEKATIEVYCDNMMQNYGQVAAPLPTFSANIGGGDYSITYDGSLTMPVDAGSYIATITVNHKNYRGSRDISFIINKAPIQIDTQPTLSNIRYGQGLVDIVVTGGRVLHNYLTEIPGSFKVVNVISSSGNLVVGDNVVTVRFTPVNANYTTLEFPVVISVLKAIASIDFRNLELEYDAYEKSPDFIIMPDNSIRASVSYYSNGVLLSSAPVNAGTYTISVTVNDINYEGSRTSTFTIKKAKAKEVILPTTSDLVYMEAVKNSNFSGGSMVYIIGNDPVPGVYRFAQEGAILGNAGRTYDVPFIFQPLDSANYDIYEGLIRVTVVKKEALITVENNVITYGSSLANLKLKTSPSGLSVSHDILNTEYIYDAGSYTYTAVINDENYKGKLKFSVTILKKSVSFVFYKSNNRANVITNGYETTYNVPLYAQAYIQGLINKDLPLENSINNQIIYEYFSKDRSINYGHIPPRNAGEYVVVARLSHNNYYVNDSFASMPYNIARAEVEDIIFDSRSLNTQVYGDVQPPVITTSPYDIRLEITYIGYGDKMPTNAGFYTVKATALDPNYMAKEKYATFKILPRRINITNIRVEDKVFNNTANLVITAGLTGVLIGDEVSVQLTARCKDGKANVGYHDVEILSYMLVGRHADNYIANPPVYTEQVRITDNKVKDEVSQAYMTSSKGFDENVMIKVTTVDSVNNKGGLLSALTGQESTVQSFTVMEGDQEMPLTDMVKVYIKIPDKYLNEENLEIIPLGNLAYTNVTFDREGDYITFYTNTTGEIMFVSSKAPTSAILFVSSGALLVIGLMMVFITNPVRKRKKVTPDRFKFMR
jgi:hypothetical protein